MRTGQRNEGRMALVANAIVLALFILMNSCAGMSDEFANLGKDEVKSVRLILDADLLNTYEGSHTRSSSDWKDGDRVYIFFTDGKTVTSGEAKYEAEEQIWTFNYYGSLPSDNKSKCRIFFFENIKDDSDEEVVLDHTSLVYSDEDCDYEVSENALVVSTILTPSFGRVRFEGTSGQSYDLHNVLFCSSFSKHDGSFTFGDTPVALDVDENGTTPYVYCKFEDDARTLTLYKEGVKSYEMKCGEEVLSVGKSGYILLPSDEDENGWETFLPTLPKVRTGEAYDIVYYEFTSDWGWYEATVSGEILSLGNCEKLFEYGHIYSLNPNPTFENGKKYKHNPTSELGEFQSFLYDLDFRTKYYVRAYARNEVGYAYGDVVEFMTGYGNIRVEIWSHPVSYESTTIVGDIFSGGHEILDAGYYYNDTGFPSEKYKIVKATEIEEIEPFLIGDCDYRFWCTFEGLDSDTKYYIKPYVVTESGTFVYDDVWTFTTKARDVNISVEDYGTDKEW